MKGKLKSAPNLNVKIQICRITRCLAFSQTFIDATLKPLPFAICSGILRTLWNSKFLARKHYSVISFFHKAGVVDIDDEVSDVSKVFQSYLGSVLRKYQEDGCS